MNAPDEPDAFHDADDDRLVAPQSPFAPDAAGATARVTADAEDPAVVEDADARSTLAVRVWPSTSLIADSSGSHVHPSSRPSEVPASPVGAPGSQLVFSNNVSRGPQSAPDRPEMSSYERRRCRLDGPAGSSEASSTSTITPPRSSAIDSSGDATRTATACGALSPSTGANATGNPPTTLLTHPSVPWEDVDAAADDVDARASVPPPNDTIV
ncbi:hypothetical protein [Cellulomonas sp. PSBB021]|uniref:hypothetical protein n=1 Tax=Cellulomonas sp. PSBB021 TaxID=2003551 RepID=UPI0012FD9871|nr:hypothetical protein [Cellulomonas sp. PSBB021]